MHGKHGPTVLIRENGKNVDVIFRFSLIVANGMIESMSGEVLR